MRLDALFAGHPEGADSRSGLEHMDVTVPGGFDRGEVVLVCRDPAYVLPATLSIWHVGLVPVRHMRKR